MDRKKKKNSKKETANYLDFVPVHSKETRYEINDGRVTIFQDNKGAFNWIAQKFFGKPRVSQIHLDEMGNFIWPLIDGKRSIGEISLLIKEEFGEAAEPLYDRAVQYFKTLVSYGFIELNKTDSSQKKAKDSVK